MAKYWVTIQYLSEIRSMLVTATSPEEAGKIAMSVRVSRRRFVLSPVSIVSVQELKPGTYFIQAEQTFEVTPELLTKSVAQIWKAMDIAKRGVTTITPIEAGAYQPTIDRETGKVAWGHPSELVGKLLQEKAKSE